VRSFGSESSGRKGTHVQIRRNLKRIAVPLVAGGIAVFGLTGGASASNKANGEHLSSQPGTIVAKGSGLNLKYTSTEIKKGGSLRIVNHTNPNEPHTLSLVRGGVRPETLHGYQKCGHRGHICHEIAKWHKVQGQTVRRNPVKVGASGWSTEGDLDKTGDSVFYAGGDPATREVHAPHGTVLTFMCAIHPWMQGSITVK
jgi:hypothetical protein